MDAIERHAHRPQGLRISLGTEYAAEGRQRVGVDYLSSAFRGTGPRPPPPV